MNPALFSSYSQEWETPQDLFDALNEKHKFTLDPCATFDNRKCEKFFTKLDDGLKQSWKNERVFMNPPYGRLIGKWIAKALDETVDSATTVCLIPARTDTRWWHNYAVKGAVEFLKGRLEFQLRILDTWRDWVLTRKAQGLQVPEIRKATGLPKVAVEGILENKSVVSDVAPFPSAIVTFHPRCHHCKQVYIP
jgi:phage N-6-adenine-methyltransferase